VGSVKARKYPIMPAFLQGFFSGMLFI
jgi:hypothetical protein